MEGWSVERHPVTGMYIARNIIGGCLRTFSADTKKGLRNSVHMFEREYRNGETD